MTANAGVIRAVLIDLSGTLLIDDMAIKGATAALERLRVAGLQVRFVSNTTKESTRSLLNRLYALGFVVKPSEVFTSLSASKKLIKSRGLRPMLFVHPDAMEEFADVDMSGGEPNAVMIGLAPEQFHYAKLNEAFQLIKNNEDAVILAMNKSRYFETKKGLCLGPGAFVAALEYSTSRVAEIVGKPSPLFFQTILHDLDMEPTEAVMIGDDVRDDIGGAQSMGMMGLLVKTGKYRPGDEQTPGIIPTQVLDDFPSAADWLIRANLPQ